MGLSREISNANVVTLIESKLPRILQLEWYRLIHRKDSDIDKNNKFPHLLEFLKVERDAHEYAMSDFRSNLKRVNVNVFNDLGNSIGTEKRKQCLIHKSRGHITENCRSYTSMNVNGRYDLLKENAACFSCLCPGHMMNNCSNQSPCSDTCDKLHHSSLHSGTFNAALHTVIDNVYKDTVILPIMKVRVNSKKCPYVNVLWDSGSSVSLITKHRAKEMKLKGKAITLRITTAGGVENILYSNKYQIPLIDSCGRVITLSVYGIEKITTEISSVDVENICTLFHNISHTDISRPSGEIDILVGYNSALFH